MHVVGCDEFVGERVDFLLRECDALVFERHRIRHVCELRSSDIVSAVAVTIVERLARHEGVDEIAVEGVGDFLQGFEANLHVCFGCFELMERFLIHLQDGSQFGLAHSEGCAYSADPAGAWLRQLDDFESRGPLVKENLIFDVSGHGLNPF